MTDMALEEREKYKAEAEFFRQNARVAAALAAQEEVNLRVRERAEKEVLARDEYHNVYVFDTDVDETSVKTCVQALTAWARKDAGCKIEIQLNTRGGDIFSGFALIDFIRDLRSRGHEITIVVYGEAASMGAVILQAGDRRVMGANSFMLLHEGSLFTGGDFAKAEDEINLFKKLQERILTILESRASVDAAHLKRKWRRTDWWLSASEALEIGLVDEVR